MKADGSGNDWYDYCNQEWANVVTVTDETRNTYMNASSGTVISMNDINTMWVWIPRYEYMYTNLGSQYAGGTVEAPGEIKVNFLAGTSTTPSDSTNYKVHPAFTFGSDELEGLWVAKFETGGTLSSTCTNTSCNTSNVVVKPGVEALTNQTVSSFFNMARSMQMSHANIYGFSKTDSDLHMGKNSEWGSVAYFSQSKYGKYGNTNYVGIEKEVRTNNCSNRITGIGADSQKAERTTTTCTINTYETANGQAASTTGNITGIYDMSGGSYEYVMTNLNNVFSSSGFQSWPASKYYEIYTSNSYSTACSGGVCFGHAASETLEWYGGCANMENNWLSRGGAYRDFPSIFSINTYTGGVHIDDTIRLILVPIQ